MPLTPVGPETMPLVAPLPGTATDTPIWAIVLAGGIGSRFWPISSPQRPKPALQLLGERSLVADTIHRLAPVVPAERVLVVTSRDIAPAVRAAARDVPPANVLVEPRPLGTAAALAWALQVVRDRGGQSAAVCVLHADLAAAFPEQFRQAVQRATALALREHALVALATAPTRPETAFGYFVPGDELNMSEPLEDGGACHALRFVEKPDLPAVTELLSAGAFWHTGVLVAPVADLQQQLFEHAVEIEPGRDALMSGNMPVFAGMVRPISIERGLLERSERTLIIPVECGWDDVGTWACLRRARDLDDDGNGAIGDAFFCDSESNVVHSEAGTVVLFGCQRMLVVTLNGLTFVTPLDKAADLKPLLDQLPGHLRNYLPPTA